MLKKISNLGSILSRNEQKLTFGGSDGPKYEDITGDGSGGGNGCPWNHCRNFFGRCTPIALQTCV